MFAMTQAQGVHAGMYRFLVMVAEFDRRGLYESWECTTTAQWLSWKCAIAVRTAREQVRVARALEQLPQRRPPSAGGSCPTPRCGPWPGSRASSTATRAAAVQR